MMARCLNPMALAFLCLMGLQLDSHAADTVATLPSSRTSVFVGAKSTEFYVHFDRPVNHALSSLVVVRDGQVIETLGARLEAAPNVLFARIPTPPSGRYVLRWTFCPAGTADRYTGEIPFTIGD